MKYICHPILIFTTSFVSFSNSINIPVIFVHLQAEKSFYLKYSLTQAKKFNPRVILISDAHNNLFPEIECHNLFNYCSGAKKFISIYKHLSPNEYPYEIFCFQRWFILKEFMHSERIEKCFYCDSDVMLYCNTTEEYNKYYSRYEASLMEFLSDGFNAIKGKVYTGGVAFWSKTELENFCKHLEKSFKNKSKISRWENLFKSNQYNEGLSDMTLLTDYKYTRSNKYDLLIGNLHEIRDDSVFDHYLASDDQGNYVMKKDKPKRLIKDIVFKNGFPYCYNKKLKKYIRLKALHFQADLKMLMSEYMTE